MKSLRELYKIGRGPSSSHTMGPEKACILFEKIIKNADSFKVILYGSLALTGKGHGTDEVIKRTLSKPCEVIFDKKTTELKHPNTMDLFAYDKFGKIIDKWRVISVGGGSIEIEGHENNETLDIYPHNSYENIIKYCKENQLTIPEYVFQFENEDIKDYLYNVWKTMKESIKLGLEAEGILPGGLNTERKAKKLFLQIQKNESPEIKENRLVSSYAFAVSEQNANGGVIVTAPTCGSSGILPAVLNYFQIKNNLSDENIINALCTAGIIGNIVKTNASISGAECGCQAEIGTACSMAAAGIAQILDMDFSQIEYASEVAMEHNLGLTCDPINGLVQIPCIERNATGAMKAVNAAYLAYFLTSSRQISFDTIVDTMYQTGLDMNKNYRETSKGGLATHFSSSKLFNKNKNC